VPDTPGRFIYFDLPDFVRRMDSLPDDPRRDYFLNRLTKSSLLGVSPLGPEFQGTRHEVLALLMRVLLLAMVTVCLGGALFMRQVPWRRYRVYVGAAIIMFTFLLAFRIRAPNEFHEDFRHIFPALVPFCVGYAVIVDRARRVSRVLYWAGVTVALLMVGSSVAFFVRMP
jgi:hypothetical protein